MASRKAKVEFSDEEKEELLKAFEGGMNSVSKDRLPKIQELARALYKRKRMRSRFVSGPVNTVIPRFKKHRFKARRFFFWRLKIILKSCMVSRI